MSSKTYLLTISAILISFLIGGCNNVRKRDLKASYIDSLIFDIGTRKDYARMIEVTDSLETAGDLSSLDANRWRGVAYYHQGDYAKSEECYRKAIDSEVKTLQDQLSYNKSARRLSELLLVKGDFEGSLRIALPAISKMEKSGIGSDIDYAILHNNIGCCQLNMGRVEEAIKSFEIAREHYANRWQTDKTSRGFQEAVVGTVYTSMAFINTRRYADAIYWIDRTEMLLNKYMQKPDARKEYFDEYIGKVKIMRAVALQYSGKKEEAEEAYKEFLKTNYSKNTAGRINANDYLMAAKRYKESADNYRYLNSRMKEAGLDMSLDNMQLFLLPKYEANKEIGRRDSAIKVGMEILAVLDSAITSQKNSRTAELATIYDTQGKEAEIARQQADLSQQRLISTGVALVLLIIFFIIYTLHKRKAQHHLAAAHQKLEEAHNKLKTAYDQLETTTKAKERIESELRIARNIQQSIVPHVFPKHEKLDIYAYMKPAKEVGGDLYDFLLTDNHLYFCLGDVSGKGVPAALFMAQAARMFQVMAKQQMKPADIATRLNNELVEGNDNGMFVTMFIGLVDLTSGKMDFCNAGHNPPILDHQFMKMESNAPIGLWEDLQFVGEEIENIKGKLMFIYSDGLNEAENLQQKQFGDEHLLDILKGGHFRNSQKVIEHMTGKVEEHRNGAEPNDDLTMMCLMIS